MNVPLCYFEFRFVTVRKTWAFQFTPLHWQWKGVFYREESKESVTGIVALGPFAATITEQV